VRRDAACDSVGDLSSPNVGRLFVAGFLTGRAFYGLHSSTNNAPRVLSQRRYEAQDRKAQLFFGVEEDLLFSSLRIRGNGKSRSFVDGDGNDCTAAYQDFLNGSLPCERERR
jgi:hypothetical protein